MRHGRAAGAAGAVPAVFFITMAILVLAACQPPAGVAPRAHVFEGSTMGTRFVVKVVAGTLDAARVEGLRSAIEGQLADVDARMSTYRADSELSRFNGHRSTEPFAVSAPTREVVAGALVIGERSGGALDITVGPLVDAWGFGPGKTAEPPSDRVVAALRQHVGLDKLELPADASVLVKTHPELRCDLSAVAKGYATDRVAAALEAQGMADYMVEVGGEVRTAGRNAEGQSWRIGIERPRLDRGSLQRVVALSGRAMATSGDYRNYREIDGERYSHIIDPRTGRPIRHKLASVSVVHDTGLFADGWATALLVLGPDEGWEVAVRERLAVFFLVREGDTFVERATPVFEELFPTVSR